MQNAFGFRRRLISTETYLCRRIWTSHKIWKKPLNYSIWKCQATPPTAPHTRCSAEVCSWVCTDISFAKAKCVFDLSSTSNIMQVFNIWSGLCIEHLCVYNNFHSVKSQFNELPISISWNMSTQIVRDRVFLVYETSWKHFDSLNFVIPFQFDEAFFKKLGSLRCESTVYQLVPFT